MTDSRVDDSTPCDAKTTSLGAPSQTTESDEIITKSPNLYFNSHDSDPHAVDQNPAQIALSTAPLNNESATTQLDLPVVAMEHLVVDIDSVGHPIDPPLFSSPHKTISQLAASMALTPKTAVDTSSSSLNVHTPAVLSSSSSDQGVVYEWDFWRPHAQYLSDTLALPVTHVPRYRQSLLDSCGVVATVLAHYDLLHISDVTLYAFSAQVADDVQYRFQPEHHPMQCPSQPLQQNLYYPTYEIAGMAELEPLLAQYFQDQVLPTELEFAGVGDIVGVGRFENPFSFSYEVFESFERIRIQTRSTAWLTCDLEAMPQMALYSANGWRLEQAMTDLVYFLGMQGFQLEQNQREKIAFSQDAVDVAGNATRYAEWDGDYLLNRSTLEPAGDQLLNVVKLFNLRVEYAQTIV